MKRIVSGTRGINNLRDFGKYVIAPLAGQKLDDTALELIHDYGVSSFILFKRNLVDLSEAKELCDRIDTACIKAGLGHALFAIDQEGGPVQRLVVPDYPKIPSNKQVSLDRNPWQQLFRQASLAVSTLKILGIKLNLAPVLDLADDSCNDVLFDRSYGIDANKTALLGSIYLSLLTQSGIATCAKHFPGIGAVRHDPHKETGWVSLDSDQLKMHLLPFAVAIRSGVPAIMTSHVVFKVLDSLPVTYSYLIAHDLLREKLGFKGVLITDDLEMKGAGEESVASAAVKAFKAGHDLLLICQSQNEVKETISLLSESVSSREISSDRLEISSKRIFALKSKFGLIT